jgi:hypothetical protein
VSKVTYDVSGDIPETSNAPVGWYRGKILSAEDGTSKSSGNQRVEVTIQLTHDASGKKINPDSYWPVRYYLMYADGRPYALRGIKEFNTALGLPLKGAWDLAKLKNKTMSVKLKADTDQDGEYQPRIAKLTPLGETEDAPAVADEPEDDATPVEPDEPDADEEEGDEEEEDGIDLDALDRAGLKKFIKDEGLEIRVMKSMSDDDVREAITEAVGTADEEEPDDEEEDDGEEEAGDREDSDEEADYSTMSVKDLSAEVKERELDTAPFKGLKGAKLKTALVAALTEDDESNPF